MGKKSRKKKFAQVSVSEPAQEIPEPKKIPVLVCIVLIVCLGLAAYINSINNPFIYDDQFIVENNPAIRSWSNIPAVFAQNIGSPNNS